MTFDVVAALVSGLAATAVMSLVMSLVHASHPWPRHGVGAMLHFVVMGSAVSGAF